MARVFTGACHGPELTRRRAVVSDDCVGRDSPEAGRYQSSGSKVRWHGSSPLYGSVSLGPKCWIDARRQQHMNDVRGAPGVTALASITPLSMSAVRPATVAHDVCD